MACAATVRPRVAARGVRSPPRRAAPPPLASRRLESETLPPSDLTAIETLVERNDGVGLTAGDAARATGLPLARAEAALAALAADAGGALRVSSAGDVVYVVPTAVRTILRSKSALLRLRPAVDAAVAGASYAARAAVGAALLASVALVFTALAAASAAGSDDRDRGRGRAMPVSFYISPADLWLWFDPYAYRRARASVGDAGRGGRRGEPALGFLEAVFDVVFGGPDPNADYDAARWAAVSAAIEAAGGVVTAEQLAPYLDEGSSGRAADDESFVVPALVRFGGHADVDGQGRLLYYFPTLATTATRRGLLGAPSPRPRLPPPTLEAPVPFTRASPGQRAAVLALAVANFAGVSALGGLLADAAGAAALSSAGFAFVGGLFPFLRVYAAAFFVLPLLRWLWIRRVNDSIAARNEARSGAAATLAAPSRETAAKLSAAAAAAARGDGARVVPDVVFDSAASELGDAELDAFDAKLARRQRGGRG